MYSFDDVASADRIYKVYCLGRNALTISDPVEAFHQTHNCRWCVPFFSTSDGSSSLSPISWAFSSPNMSDVFLPIRMWCVDISQAWFPALAIHTYEVMSGETWPSSLVSRADGTSISLHLIVWFREIIVIQRFPWKPLLWGLFSHGICGELLCFSLPHPPRGRTSSPPRVTSIIIIFLIAHLALLSDRGVRGDDLHHPIPRSVSMH